MQNSWRRSEQLCSSNGRACYGVGRMLLTERAMRLEWIPAVGQGFFAATQRPAWQQLQLGGQEALVKLVGSILLQSSLCLIML
jgi:hypothetical protein